MCQHLVGKLREVVVLDADILWRADFDRPEEKHQGFFETWLRICKNISQAGKPVLSISAGAIPANVEPCVERRYFSTVYYLALVCEDEELTDRLEQRPAWRRSSDADYIEEHIKFNRWFKERGRDAKPAIDLIDTTGMPVEETTNQVAGWVREKVFVSL
jgi:hypothetical protein